MSIAAELRFKARCMRVSRVPVTPQYAAQQEK